MEDKSATPGGLNPDVPAKLRRAHRMPVGKAHRGATVEDGVVSAVSPEAPASSAELPEVATSDSDADTDADAPGTALVGPGPTAESPEVSEEFGGNESADTIDELAPDETVADPETSTPVVFAERKPVGKWLKVGVAATAALFVAAAGFAGATVQPYLADRALVTIKGEIAKTAASAITTLWTYTPEDMGALPDRASQFLSGEFDDAYRQYVDGIAATNKQAQVSNDTQVLSAAVESIGPSEATAIVYTNSTATSPLTKGIPSLRYVSYRLTLERHDAKWLVSRMSTVTSLDLTPQL